MNGKLALPLIEALGQRIKKSGKTAYFVHVSIPRPIPPILPRSDLPKPRPTRHLERPPTGTRVAGTMAQSKTPTTCWIWRSGHLAHMSCER